MEGLIHSCIFAQEWDSDADATIGSRLASFAASGGAEIVSTGAFHSFYAKEERQSDVRRLPTGARTLLLDPATGDVLVRGVNKFPDLESVSPSWSADPSLWSASTVWLQRKLAGFLVTLFSLDGVRLCVATKHVVAGPHVSLADRLLSGLLSPAQRAALAADLFSLGAALTGEAVARAADGGHPVLEAAAHDGAIVFFSLHRRAGGRERCAPFAEARRRILRWGLPAVPAWRARSGEELDEWLRARGKWRASAPDGTPLAEGFVVVVEVPLARVAEALGKDAAREDGGDVGDFSVAPVRLKAKTTKYRVRRALRSLARGESSAQPLQFHEAVAQWAVHIAGYPNVAEAIEKRGVSALCDEFETFAAAHAHTQHPGASMTVGDAFSRLIAVAEHEVNVLQRAPLHVAMLCGLPGSGKSSLARALCAAAASGSGFRHVVRLSRDEIAADIAQQEETINLSSRRLRPLVHRALVTALHRVVALSMHLEGPTLLLLDACHAGARTRQTFRALFPRHLDSFVVLYLACDDRALLARRLALRTEHETLHDVAAAQAALHRVGIAFDAPAASDECMRLDTTAATADTLAPCVLARYNFAPKTSAALYDHRTVSAELFARRAPLIGAVVGTSDPAESFGALLRGEKSPFAICSAARRCVMARLDISPSDALFDAAANAIARATGACAAAAPGGLWKRLRDALSFGFGDSTDEREKEKREGKEEGEGVRAGHTRWLRGFFLRGRKENWRQAVRAHFERRAAVPHVTVAVGKDCAAVPKALAAGSAVDVRLESVVLDHLAMCFRASIVADGERFTTQCGKDNHTVLHVTLGHTAKVKAVYAGTMLDLVEKWEHHNKNLEKMRLVGGGVKRSREKFVNFSEIALEKPLLFQGVMVETHIQESI